MHTKFQLQLRTCYLLIWQVGRFRKITGESKSKLFQQEIKLLVEHAMPSDRILVNQLRRVV